MDLLKCPECGKELELEFFSKKDLNQEKKIKKVMCKHFCYKNKEKINDKIDCSSCYKIEIKEGLLKCDCGMFYPIINGIPRMLPKYLQKNLFKYHKTFLNKYKNRIPHLNNYNSKIADTGKATKRTLKSYSYQWQTFDEIIREWKHYFLEFVYPLKPNYFNNRLILDAGCGFGRFAIQATDFGGEVIGMDLSEAVQSANMAGEDMPHLHFVQGDIYNLPFKKDFDLIYCIGVLQHLPKKVGGFMKLAELSQKGKGLFIWVYNIRKGLYKSVDIMRKFTTKMPFRILNSLCFGLAVMQYLMIIYPYKLLNAFKITSSLAKKMSYTHYAEYPFRHCHADWFDRLSVPLTGYFTKSQVKSWYKETNFKDIVVIGKNDMPNYIQFENERISPHIEGWRGFGIKK